MKNKFVSLLAIILGIIIIAFPMIGVIGTSSLIGLSVLLISIYLLVAGVAIIDYNKSGAIIDLILGIILLFLSLGLIFNPNLFATNPAEQDPVPQAKVLPAPLSHV